MIAPEKHTIKVYGLIKEVELYQSKVTAEGLHQKFPDKFSIPVCQGMIENQWIMFIDELKQKTGKLKSFNNTTLIFCDNDLLGSAAEFMSWSEKKHELKDVRPLPLFHALAKEGYKQHLKSTQHDFVYFDVTIGKEYAGRMLIELFNDILPRTCTNFLRLNCGDHTTCGNQDSSILLSYKGSSFHRIVKNGWIQGGDIVHGAGNSGWSIYGETFEDENYAIKHSKRGIVGMANKGRHSNASQFYITLQAAEWMDCKYVAFGEVVEGLGVLDKLENVETYNERPIQECVIGGCGLIDTDAL